MLNKIFKDEVGHGDLGWLKTRFHFSFADYYNPEKMNFHTLRVLNDDLIAPNNGFGMHPHQDMEIISYVLNGTLSHTDNMGNKKSLRRGGVQYLSAGTGIRHSEFNHGDDVVRLLQIWILPDFKNHVPSYGDLQFNDNDYHDKLLKIVSSKDGDGFIKINQNVNIYVIETSENFEFSVKFACYVVQIEGSSLINGVSLLEGDAIAVENENLRIDPSVLSHFILIEFL